LKFFRLSDIVIAGLSVGFSEDSRGNLKVNETVTPFALPEAALKRVCPAGSSDDHFGFQRLQLHKSRIA